LLQDNAATSDVNNDINNVQTTMRSSSLQLIHTNDEITNLALLQDNAATNDEDNDINNDANNDEIIVVRNYN
jgi:hypothetical protein